MNSGIYKILNKINDKFYIGSAVDLPKRWREHQRKLNEKTHKNAHLQAAWDKYWNTSFEFVILEICSKDMLIEREQFWINATNCCDRSIGYNLNPTAGNMLGFKHSEETKLKFKNRIYTDEIKANMSKGQTGKKYGYRPGNKGRIVSDKVKAQTSQRHKGKILSLETKALISAANKGRKISAEAIAKREASRKRNKEIKLIPLYVIELKKVT